MSLKMVLLLKRYVTENVNDEKMIKDDKRCLKSLLLKIGKS